MSDPDERVPLYVYREYLGDGRYSEPVTVYRERPIQWNIGIGRSPGAEEVPEPPSGMSALGPDLPDDTPGPL